MSFCTMQMLQTSPGLSTLSKFHMRRLVSLKLPSFKSARLVLANPKSRIVRIHAAQEDLEEFDFGDEAYSSDSAGQPLANADNPISDDDGESRDFAIALAKVCWETKGEDLMVLHVAPLVYWTRYMILVTVFSKPQLNAILAKVEQEAFSAFDRRPSAPATGASAWELLDFGDVVVHVLTAEQRDYYDIESFYAAAEEIDLPFVNEQNRPPAWETKL